MISNIERLELNNGLAAGFVHKKASDCICIHVRGLAGSNYEYSNKKGSAHLLEHALMENSLIGKIANLDSKVVAICSRDDVIYGFKIYKDSLIIVLDYITKLLNQKIEIKQNLTKIKSEVCGEIFRHTTNPEKFSTRIIYKILYPNNRISYLNTGEIGDIETVYAKDLANYYAHRYRPKYFTITVTGDLNSETKKLILHKLENIDKNNTKKVIPIREYVKLNECSSRNTQIITNSNFPGELLKLNYFGKTICDNEKYPLAIATKIIGSRVKNLIQEKCFKYSCVNFSTGSYGLIDITIGLMEKSSKRVLKKIFNEINLSRADENTVNIIKKGLISNLLLSTEKITTLTDYYSELMLHGNKDQDMSYEIESIHSCTLDKVNKSLEFIKNQQPKITLLQ